VSRLKIVPDSKFSSAEFDVQSYEVHLLLASIQVHGLTGKKKMFESVIEYATYEGIRTMMNVVELDLKEELWKKKSEKERSRVTRAQVVVRKFYLYVLDKSLKHTILLTEQNALPMIMLNPVVYVEFLQHSYSDTSNVIFDKFIFPFELPAHLEKRNDVYDEICKKNTHEAEQKAAEFVRIIGLPENEKAFGTWTQAVSRAVTVLEDCQVTIPHLDVYNEATRRLIIDPVLAQVSKYLSATMLVKAYQCAVPSEPPEHFAGSGPLDYVYGIGGMPPRVTEEAEGKGAPVSTETVASGPRQVEGGPSAQVSVCTLQLWVCCVMTYLARTMSFIIFQRNQERPAGRVPTSVTCYPHPEHVRVAVERKSEAELSSAEGPLSGAKAGSEEEEAEEASESIEAQEIMILQDDDVLSHVHTTTSAAPEAKIVINNAAFRQVCAQSYDKSFVDDNSLMLIAEKVAARTPQEADALTRKTKRKHEVVREEPVRQHKKVISVLTTAHTWQVFRFTLATTEMHDVNAKQRVAMLGTFRMPVLRNTRQEGTASGVTGPMVVDRDSVERVMAMLVLAVQGGL
jgi:hypothetical protein